jgi:hypothetical protein
MQGASRARCQPTASLAIDTTTLQIVDPYAEFELEEAVQRELAKCAAATPLPNGVSTALLAGRVVHVEAATEAQSQ